MKRWAWGSAAILLLGVLAAAIVFAVWASVGDAPWEKTTACAAASPCPSPSQEEVEKTACLQGGGMWRYFEATNSYHNTFCGSGSAPCWACFHVLR
jgi:hypothetical protein